MLSYMTKDNPTAVRRFPGAALLLTVTAVAIHALPSLALWLQYDRTAMAAGQWWRLVTCHWTHWSWDHLLWDALVFAFLGALCERDGRGRFVICLITSAVMVPVAVWLACPYMVTYRGLSGVDSALFTLLVATIVKDKIAIRSWLWVVIALGISAAFGAKLIYEIVSGATFFSDSAAAGFVPVPVAHAVGAVIGLVCAIVNNPTHTGHDEGNETTKTDESDRHCFFRIRRDIARSSIPCRIAQVVDFSAVGHIQKAQRPLQYNDICGSMSLPS